MSPAQRTMKFPGLRGRAIPVELAALKEVQRLALEDDVLSSIISGVSGVSSISAVSDVSAVVALESEAAQKEQLASALAVAAAEKEAEAEAVRQEGEVAAQEAEKVDMEAEKVDMKAAPPSPEPVVMEPVVMEPVVLTPDAAAKLESEAHQLQQEAQQAKKEAEALQQQAVAAESHAVAATATETSGLMPMDSPTPVAPRTTESKLNAAREAFYTFLKEDAALTNFYGVYEQLAKTIQSRTARRAFSIKVAITAWRAFAATHDLYNMELTVDGLAHKLTDARPYATEAMFAALQGELACGAYGKQGVEACHEVSVIRKSMQQPGCKFVQPDTCAEDVLDAEDVVHMSGGEGEEQPQDAAPENVAEQQTAQEEEEEVIHDQYFVVKEHGTADFNMWRRNAISRSDLYNYGGSKGAINAALPVDVQLREFAFNLVSSILDHAKDTDNQPANEIKFTVADDLRYLMVLIAHYFFPLPSANENAMMLAGLALAIPNFTEVVKEAEKPEATKSLLTVKNVLIGTGVAVALTAFGTWALPAILALGGAGGGGGGAGAAIVAVKAAAAAAAVPVATTTAAATAGVVVTSAVPVAAPLAIPVVAAPLATTALGTATGLVTAFTAATAGMLTRLNQTTVDQPVAAVQVVPQTPVVEVPAEVFQVPVPVPVEPLTNVPVFGPIWQDVVEPNGVQNLVQTLVTESRTLNPMYTHMQGVADADLTVEAIWQPVPLHNARSGSMFKVVLPPTDFGVSFVITPKVQTAAIELVSSLFMNVLGGPSVELIPSSLLPAAPGGALTFAVPPAVPAVVPPPVEPLTIQLGPYTPPPLGVPASPLLTTAIRHAVQQFAAQRSMSVVALTDVPSQPVTLQGADGTDLYRVALNVSVTLATKQNDLSRALALFHDQPTPAHAQEVYTNLANLISDVRVANVAINLVVPPKTPVNTTALLPARTFPGPPPPPPTSPSPFAIVPVSPLETAKLVAELAKNDVPMSVTPETQATFNQLVEEHTATLIRVKQYVSRMMDTVLSWKDGAFKEGSNKSSVVAVVAGLSAVVGAALMRAFSNMQLDKLRAEMARQLEERISQQAEAAARNMAEQARQLEILTKARLAQSESEALARIAESDNQAAARLAEERVLSADARADAALKAREIQELVMSRDKNGAEIIRLNAEIAAKQEEALELIATVKAQELEAQRIHTETLEFESNYKHLFELKNTTIAQLNTEKAELVLAGQSLTARIEDLQRAVAEKNADLAIRVKALDDAAVEKLALQEVASKARENMLAGSVQNQLLTRSMQELQTELNKKLAQFGADKEELQTLVRTLQDNVNELNMKGIETLDQLRLKEADLEMEYAERVKIETARKEEREANRLEFEAKRDETQREIDATRKELTRIRVKAAAKIDTLKQRLKVITAEGTTAREDFRKLFSKSTATFRKLRSNLDALQNELAKSEAARAAVEGSLQQVTADVKAKALRITSLETDVDTLTRRETDLASKLERQNVELVDLQTQYDTKEREYNQLLNSLALQTVQIQEQQAALRDKDVAMRLSEIQQNAKIEQESRKMRELNMGLINVEKNRDYLQTELDATQEKLQAAKSLLQNTWLTPMAKETLYAWATGGLLKTFVAGTSLLLAYSSSALVNFSQANPGVAHAHLRGVSIPSIMPPVFPAVPAFPLPDPLASSQAQVLTQQADLSATLRDLVVGEADAPSNSPVIAPPVAQQYSLLTDAFVADASESERMVHELGLMQTDASTLMELTRSYGGTKPLSFTADSTAPIMACMTSFVVDDVVKLGVSLCVVQDGALVSAISQDASVVHAAHSTLFNAATNCMNNVQSAAALVEKVKVAPPELVGAVHLLKNMFSLSAYNVIAMAAPNQLVELAWLVQFSDEMTRYVDDKFVLTTSTQTGKPLIESAGKGGSELYNSFRASTLDAVRTTGSSTQLVQRMQQARKAHALRNIKEQARRLVNDSSEKERKRFNEHVVQDMFGAKLQCKTNDVSDLLSWFMERAPDMLPTVADVAQVRGILNGAHEEGGDTRAYASKVMQQLDGVHEETDQFTTAVVNHANTVKQTELVVADLPADTPASGTTVAVNVLEAVRNLNKHVQIPVTYDKTTHTIMQPGVHRGVLVHGSTVLKGDFVFTCDPVTNACFFTLVKEMDSLKLSGEQRNDFLKLATSGKLPQEKVLTRDEFQTQRNTLYSTMKALAIKLDKLSTYQQYMGWSYDDVHTTVNADLAREYDTLSADAKAERDALKFSVLGGDVIKVERGMETHVSVARVEDFTERWQWMKMYDAVATGYNKEFDLVSKISNLRESYDRILFFPTSVAVHGVNQADVLLTTAVKAVVDEANYGIAPFLTSFMNAFIPSYNEPGKNEEQKRERAFNAGCFLLRRHLNQERSFEREYELRLEAYKEAYKHGAESAFDFAVLRGLEESRPYQTIYGVADRSTVLASLSKVDLASYPAGQVTAAQEDVLQRIPDNVGSIVMELAGFVTNTTPLSSLRDTVKQNADLYAAYAQRAMMLGEVETQVEEAGKEPGYVPSAMIQLSMGMAATLSTASVTPQDVMQQVVSTVADIAGELPDAVPGAISAASTAALTRTQVARLQASVLERANILSADDMRKLAGLKGAAYTSSLAKKLKAHDLKIPTSLSSKGVIDYAVGELNRQALTNMAVQAGKTIVAEVAKDMGQQIAMEAVVSLLDYAYSSSVIMMDANLSQQRLFQVQESIREMDAIVEQAAFGSYLNSKNQQVTDPAQVAAALQSALQYRMALLQEQQVVLAHMTAKQVGRPLPIVEVARMTASVQLIEAKLVEHLRACPSVVSTLESCTEARCANIRQDVGQVVNTVRSLNEYLLRYSTLAPVNASEGGASAINELLRVGELLQFLKAPEQVQLSTDMLIEKARQPVQAAEVQTSATVHDLLTEVSKLLQEHVGATGATKDMHEQLITDLAASVRAWSQVTVPHTPDLVCTPDIPVNLPVAAEQGAEGPS